MQAVIHGFFDRACAKCEVDEKTGVIDCSDLNFPDPSVTINLFFFRNQRPIQSILLTDPDGRPDEQ